MYNSIKRILILLAAAVALLNAQQVIKNDKIKGTLKEQFESVFQSQKNTGNYWIGYSIKRNDKNMISVGTFFIDNDLPVNFGDLLSGKVSYESYQNARVKNHGMRISGHSIQINRGRWIEKEKDSNETAILFRYDINSEKINDAADIAVCNFGHYMDLQSYPVFWLGKSTPEQSARFLIDEFNNTGNWYVKEEFIPAIGVHTNQPGVTEFLKNIFYSDAGKDLREDVITWIGLQNNHTAFEILKKIINEESVDFGERAASSLVYFDSDEALYELINLAKHSNVSEIREHAIYGLGNKAVKKAEETLKDVVENDPDIEIKKRAIYALADREEKSIEYLIELAKNNPSLTVRKTAIYSLSNFEDNKKAVDALIELAKNN